MKFRLRLFSAALCGLLHAVCSTPAWAQASAAADSAQPKPRPKIALVLSGGGARGFAHIGVLRVLQEMRVPVDIVVGTSMGSVVGGAYAAGSSVESIEQLVHRTDWNNVIADRPPRDELTFRRREEDLLLPSRIELGATLNGVMAPPSAAGNAALEQTLARVLPPGTHDTPVNELALPFRSVASDLVNGALVELDDTPLFLTMRASLAVPGVFAPVRIKHRLVVDGGLVRNLPIDVARKMGADIIIAVNVGTPLAPEKDLGSAIGVAQQMLQILTEQNVQRSLKELTPGTDILIAPDLNGIGFLDFQQHDRAIEAGEEAARAISDRLAPLALSDADYTAYETHRLAAPASPDKPVPLLALNVAPSGHINPQALKVESGLVEGAPVTREQIRQAAASLYGRGDLARVETEVQDTPAGRTVEIDPTESDWARSRLRVGLELASDFNDNNSFAIKVMHVRSSIDDWGAELRTIARIGTQREFSSEFWQPLGAGASWYVAPSVDYNAFSSDVFNQGLRTNRIGVNGASATMAVGRELGNGGDLRFGVTRQHANVRVIIPEDSGSSGLRVDDTEQFVQLRFDTLDSVAFPTRGTLFDATVQRSLSSVTQQSLASSQVQVMDALHAGSWAGHLYGEWAHSQDGSAPLQLGGFLRLSGTQPESVEGRSIVLGRVVVARAIGAMPAALGGVVRLGFSAELGGGYESTQALHFSTLKQAGSAFVAVDTRFGPVYFGAGATRGGSGTLYLFLGPIW